MKKILTVIALAAVFAACNNTAQKNAAIQANKDSIKKAMIDSLKLDSFQRAERTKKEKEAAQQAAIASSSAARRATYVKGYSESHTYAEPNYSSKNQTAKKGWSSAAKGATIGGAAGAVTGILVDKKNARGAIIGGVVGAGTGYVIGRANDRKTGRVQPKE